MTMTSLEFIDSLRWIDGKTSMRSLLEPYRRRIFVQALDMREPSGRPQYNLIVCGRAKKNWKSCDLVLAALYALLDDSPIGNEIHLFSNDENQAGDNLALAKKLIEVNPPLKRSLIVKQKVIDRADGKGFLMILPAQDVVGAHGKTYRFCGFDEIHGYRNWDLLEAMQPDPTRLDTQVWITSYASIYHKPGVPLFDLCQAGWAGTDPRMLFSWYGADRTTDPDFAELDPESRANPSRTSWADPGYLEQQRRRLPAHKFRRLHLNLPGLPEGSAFQPEPIMAAVARGISDRSPAEGVSYQAFVDMSGGSSDDAVLAIGHTDADDRAVVDRIVNQGQPVPFDPNLAVERFVAVLFEYGLCQVTGDKYAGETFKAAFERQGISYQLAPLTKSQMYEALEPHLNGHRLVLLDRPEVEQQLLGLIWRGGKIDHPAGEHDDWANAVAGLTVQLLQDATPELEMYCGGQSTADERDDNYAVRDRRSEEQKARDERVERSRMAIADSCKRAGVWWP